MKNRRFYAVFFLLILTLSLSLAPAAHAIEEMDVDAKAAPPMT